MGSLMDGIEVTPAAQKAAKAAATSSETAKTVKLAVAIVGLLIGGALIAWNMGLFGAPAAATADKNLTAEPQPQSTPAPVATPRRPVPPPLTGAEPPQHP